MQLQGVDEYVNKRVTAALAELDTQQSESTVKGLEMYAESLRRSRLRSSAVIRPISRRDDRAVAKIIRTVMPEFGLTGSGFAIADPEVDSMSKAYRAKRSRYLVIEADARVLGGAGIGPLKGGDNDICELQKMYFLPELRGLGLGRRLLSQLMDQAKKFKYKRIYLETVRSMKAANSLYEELGFIDLAEPLGATGHCGCQRWMIKEL